MNLFKKLFRGKTEKTKYDKIELNVSCSRDDNDNADNDNADNANNTDGIMYRIYKRVKYYCGCILIVVCGIVGVTLFFYVFYLPGFIIDIFCDFGKYLGIPDYGFRNYVESFLSKYTNK
jgi:hypothetical protein